MNITLTTQQTNVEFEVYDEVTSTFKTYPRGSTFKVPTTAPGTARLHVETKLIGCTGRMPVETIFTVDVLPTAAFMEGIESSVVTLINEHRAANGRAPLTVSNDLRTLARNWSQDQLSANPSPNDQGHDPNGGTDAAQFGFTKHAENISTVRYVEGLVGQDVEIHTALVNSPRHNANMLNSEYTHVGVGFVVVDTPGPGFKVFLTERFGGGKK